MTQRTLAGLVAVVLLGALVALAVFRPLPYVSYEPGSTIDLLGQADGKEIIQVSGHKAYRDDGELRMTTVLVSTPGARLDLFTLMSDWLDPEDDVYPYALGVRPGRPPTTRTARRARRRWSTPSRPRRRSPRRRWASTSCT